MNRLFYIVTLLVCISALTACGAMNMFSTGNRYEIAKRLAAPVQMYPTVIKADPFMIQSYARIYKPGAPATIYIEGDGLAFISRNQPSLDPTPKNPVALHLATHDKSPNVIYLARPCQYTGNLGTGPCKDMDYWLGKRFAPEVVRSLNQAIDYMVKTNDLGPLNLVGYSGGGGLAVILAARRNDVVSVRTVAGNLDHNAFTEYHNVSPMTGSLNPVHEAANIAHIPQHHFIGEWDTVVPPGIYISYRNASRNLKCVRHSIVKKAEHDSGWVGNWEWLLEEPLDCKN